ncbi:MAG TPA: hypothetical protein PKC30_01855 [Saprospiraceae bacterium]|nr:hypothetical protein [Saprospiraceae bacterium]
MSKTKNAPDLINKLLFPYTPWVLLILIPITFLGFYPSYYSTFQATGVIHLHSALMVLWLAVAIIQPWLIKTQQIKLHRWIGKFSIVLLPMILMVGYFVLRSGYQRVFDGDEVAPSGYYPEGADSITKAGDFVVIGFIYFMWLLIYYTLGFIFRKKTYAHAPFMLGAVLTILGPSGDRLIGHIFEAMSWEFNAFAENFVFGFVFLIFGALLLFHHKRNIPLWPSGTVLYIHMMGVFFFYYLPFNSVWDRLAAIIFYTF